MRSLFAILALLATTAVFAGNGWVPYTDGRVGGCAVSNNGSLYGCTPQPPPPPEAPTPRARAPEVVYVPTLAPPPRVVERTVYVERPAPATYEAASSAAPAYVPTSAGAAAVDAQTRADVADPDAALRRELCRADPKSCQ